LEKSLKIFAPDALDSYRAQMADPARAHAMCADYRAGAFVDRPLDGESRKAGAQIAAPLHFLWAESGFPAQTGDPLALWRAWAPHVTGNACRSGHFAMEENPEAVLDAFLRHFGRN
jgi:haloacetate dehalogenase